MRQSLLISSYPGAVQATSSWKYNFSRHVFRRRSHYWDEFTLRECLSHEAVHFAKWMCARDQRRIRPEMDDANNGRRWTENAPLFSSHRVYHTFLYYARVLFRPWRRRQSRPDGRVRIGALYFSHLIFSLQTGRIILLRSRCKKFWSFLVNFVDFLRSY
jgi:hypothetical protein